MNWRSGLLALAACVGLATAQQTTAYTDPETGIQYQSFSTVVAGGYMFGISFPTTPTDEFIGHIVGPVAGWSGVSLRGSMTNSLLIIAWANGGEVKHSFRHTDAYVDPLIYDAATATTMYSSVNSTHFKYTFRCQNCTNWDDYHLDASADSAVLGWAISLDALTDPTNSDTALPYHSSGKGRYSATLSAAKFSKYQDWIDAAGPGTTVIPSPTPTPTLTSTTVVPIPTSTEVLGEYDYIVVGGGAGGLVAADRLSESGAAVLLIERGPPATAEHGGTIAPDWLKPENLTRFDVPGLCNQIWVDSKGIACEDIDHMAGCVLGGGTAVNAGMFFVPMDRDWDYNFPTGWKAKDMAAATTRMFTRIPGSDTPSMDGKRYVQETYGVLGAAVKNAGWTELASINKSPNKKLKTYGHSPFMFSNGERGGPLATYLRTAKKRANFKLVTDTMVRRVIRNGGWASGVEVHATAANGKTGIYKVKPTGRVILSAGAFGTAKILMRSGIGPKDQLDIVKASALDGASMIAESQWILSPVGYNVLDHTNTDLVISHPNVKAYDFYGAYDHPIEADAAAYIDNRAGNLASAAPGIPIVLYDQVVGTDGITRQLQWTARAEGSLGESGNTLVTISQYLGTGVSARGRIVIKSNLGMTVGTEPYGVSGQDKAAIVKGVDNMLTAIKGFSVNGTAITVLQPAAGKTAQQYVDEYVQGRGTNHWVGSARLGTDDGTKLGGSSGSVVDLNTKVYGTNNLHVVDASIFPGHVSTNPSAPILIAAEHAIKKILALRQTRPGSSTTTSTAASGTSTVVPRYGRCGGSGYTGSKTCASPCTCTVMNEFYSQCL